MAFKLKKAERNRRDELADQLEEKAAEVTQAIQEANALIQQAMALANAKIEEYNAILERASEFAEEIATNARDQIGEKSDRWQEGDNGQAASDWAEEWEGVDLSEVETVDVEEIEELDLSHAETLRELPEAA